jgi:hypothetical protein
VLSCFPARSCYCWSRWVSVVPLLINEITLFHLVVCDRGALCTSIAYECDDIEMLIYVVCSIFPGAADKVESFFSPAALFIQRWLPLFYVPSLVVVPLAVKGIPAAEGAKIGAILGIIWPPQLPKA